MIINKKLKYLYLYNITTIQNVKFTKQNHTFSDEFSRLRSLNSQVDFTSVNLFKSI